MFFNSPFRSEAQTLICKFCCSLVAFATRECWTDDRMVCQTSQIEVSIVLSHMTHIVRISLLCIILLDIIMAGCGCWFICNKFWHIIRTPFRESSGICIGDKWSYSNKNTRVSVTSVPHQDSLSVAVILLPSCRAHWDGFDWWKNR